MFHMSDHDRHEWQREQEARDAAESAQRDKYAKARERAARNAQRKLERLHRTLSESGEISDFEEEFAESVQERLGKFGSAFHDLEKGRPGDALSFAQKRVVAGMNKKVKEARRARQRAALGKDAPEAEAAETERPQRRSLFKSRGSGFKRKSGYTPRERQLDEEWEADQAPTSEKALRAVRPPEPEPPVPAPDETPARPPVGRPFLRVISNDG